MTAPRYRHKASGVEAFPILWDGTLELIAASDPKRPDSPFTLRETIDHRNEQGFMISEVVSYTADPLRVTAAELERDWYRLPATRHPDSAPESNG